VVDHNPNTGVNDATAITFSIKCYNPFKLYPVTGNIFRKWFASYFLFIHEHLISNGKSHCCNDTFTDVRFTSLLAKNV